MKFPPVSRVAFEVLLSLTIFSAPLVAQNILLTDYKGKLLPVVRARDNRPFVEVDGKQVAAEGRQFALHKVDEYWPVFISVRDLEVSSHYMELNGSDMNHEFLLHGRLETPYVLDDVFIVLELDTESAGKVIFLTEVGKLSPREPRYLSIQLPMTSPLGSGHYQIHLFTKGVEVLHSNLDPLYRESVVDRMTEKRIANVKEAAPKIFFGPQPEYPPALLKAKTSGQVVVSIRIGANGRVYDPVVKKASAPAFGEAAIAAVRLWRFLPQVKNGHSVETLADLPVDFTPPENTKKS